MRDSADTVCRCGGGLTPHGYGMCIQAAYVDISTGVQKGSEVGVEGAQWNMLLGEALESKLQR